MLDAFKTWLDAPFQGGMSATRWIAFVGLLIAAWIFWAHVLRYLNEL